MLLFTGRNEVVAKVIFLHLFVILFTGEGGGIPEGTEADPPGADTLPPPEQTPPQEQTSPSKANTPREQIQAYGLRAAGTHPTGMHSCNSNIFSVTGYF